VALEVHDEPLRDRLLAQHEPDPKQLARYRVEVEAMLLQIHRRKWWIDAVRAVLTTLGAIVLFPLAFLLGLMSVYNMASRNGPTAAWFPAMAGAVCLAAGIGLVGWFFRRRTYELIVEAGRLQAQGLEFEEQLRRRDDR
jgi:hypothetical protein